VLIVGSFEIKVSSIVPMVISIGGQGGMTPLIFIHDTDIVDRGLIMLFFGGIFFRSFFHYPPGRGLIVLIFGIFSLFFGPSFLPPPGNFFVDALDCTVGYFCSIFVSKLLNRQTI